MVQQVVGRDISQRMQTEAEKERTIAELQEAISKLDTLTGLLTICGIMYNKEPAVGFFVPMTVVGLAFTLLWLVIQRQHWKYCVHVNNRIRKLVPEYTATLEGFAGPGRPDGLEPGSVVSPNGSTPPATWQIPR